MNRLRTYTIGYPFGGSGLGASGSDAAVVTLYGESATFQSVGGIDFDAEACADFRHLTGAESLCADISKMTPEQLRAFWGPRAPDVVKGSPPCKAGSGLLPLEVAASDEYQAMNRLMLDFSRLLFAAYPRREDRPRLAGFENVPSLLSGTRARKVVDEMVLLWEGEGYLSDVRVHDLREEGGLAQRRRRLGIFFRDPVRCSSPVEMPLSRPLRAVGDVLGPLPWPDDARAGPMHRLPRLSWLNMVRLALIGVDWRDGRKPKWDWRDLPPRGQVVEWLCARGLWPTHVGVGGRQRLEEALVGIAMGTDNAGRHTNKYAVQSWGEPGRTVIGAVQLGSGAPCVADPRALESLAEGATGTNAGAWNGRPGYRGVGPWEEPSATVNGSVSATGGQGMGSVADERVLEQLGLGCACRNGFYGVLPWDKISGTVTGSLQVDCGTAAVADPRALPPARPVIALALALQLLAEGWEVPKGALAPAILAPDNTWHRPITTLELARLQGLPPVLNGAPLVLAGRSDKRWREHIGNGIPRDAAEAWGRQLLEALLLSDMGHGFRLLGGELWVAPEQSPSEAA